MSARAWLVAAVLLAPAAPLQAQSLFNSAGMGLPMEALDGRARAMGSLGIGLPGTTLLPTDPASSARLLLPAGLIAAQPSWVDLTREGTTGRRYFRGSRFPLLAAGYPVYGGMVTVHATSFLDQGFRGERPVTVDLGGTPTPAIDRFEQDGSVSTLSVGYARMINATTAVGVTVGRYAGTVSRTLVREFTDSATASLVLPYGSVGTWAYSGYLVSAGVSTDILPILRVAASATLSTDLDASATGLTTGSDRSFHIPLQIRIGASSQLAPGLTLSASATRADWSGTAGDLGAGTFAESVLAFGVGAELSQARLFGRVAPVRIGFRRTGLPFTFESGGAHEQAFAGGFALTLNETNGISLASADFAVEKGSRVGGTYHEDFWRGTVSLKVSGF